MSAASASAAGLRGVERVPAWARSGATVLILLAVIAILTPEFFTQDNLFATLRTAAILGVITLGQMTVMLVAGIDLSVGATIGLVLTVIATIGGEAPHAVPLAVGAALLAGLVIGSINGLLVAVRGVPAFVATLSMSVILEGVRLAYTDGSPSGRIPAGLRPLGTDGVGPIPYAVVPWLLVALVAGVIFTRTVFGRRIVATGTSPEVARHSGVATRRVVFLAFAACGLLAAIGGIVMSAYVGYVDRYIGAGFDLDSVAAAVLGGASFEGGRARVLGAMAAALFLTVLIQVVVLLGLGANEQLIVRGAVVVGAGALIVIRNHPR